MLWASVCSLLLCGCVSSRPGPGGIDREDLASADDAFRPVAMRVFPLTRVLPGVSGGEPSVELHIELRDQWGDTTKGVGDLTVQLFRAGLGGAPGARERAWSMSLTDLDRNAQWFDPTTRTYRIELASAPRWIAEPGAVPGVLRATLVTVQPTGRELIIWDEFILRR